MFKLRKALIEELTAFKGDRVHEISIIVDAVAEVLPKRILRETLEESLRGLVSLVLTEELITTTAHRLAGNVKRLGACRAAPVWACQRFAEWVPVQIVSVCRRTANVRGSGKQHGADLRLKIMAGTSCPLLISKWKSVRWLYHFASKMGFSRRFNHGHSGQFPYQVPEQYTSLRMAVLIEPKLSVGAPGFVNVATTAALRQWNLGVIKRRLRLDGFKCPENNPPAVPCHRCWRGYVSCPAGTHRLDFTRGECVRCRENTMIDTEQGHMCPRCLYKTNGQE